MSKKIHGPIDWYEVHRHLNNIRIAIEAGFQPSLEERKKILNSRAKRLAQQPKAKEGTEKGIDIVEFLASNEKYGIELSYVAEVYPLKEFTPLASTPPFIIGIINVRGKIYSIMDIKRFFGLPDKAVTDLNKVIIISAYDMELGILADRITGVRSIPLKELQPPLPTLTGIRAAYLKGVIVGPLAILDAPKILSDKRIIIHEEAS